MLLWLLGAWCANKAAAHDPSLSWSTIRTPHFNVHYHDGAYEIALRVARTAESALVRVVERLGHLPSGRIELVVSDEVDTANGWATVMPYNLVHVYASAPEDLSVLHDYDDHLQILLIHELTHIVHMDTVSGLPAWINRVFGRTAFPNGAQPAWFIEGVAVHLESALSSAGRLRSSLFRMYLRTAALAGAFATLDQITGRMKAWPQGTAPYLYGAFFIQYLAERFGRRVVTELSHEMSSMLIPWSLNIVARRVMDVDYPALYDEWRSSVVAEARRSLERLRTQGLSAHRPLTRRGQHQRKPRVHPRAPTGAHQVLYYSSPTDDWPSLRMVDSDGGADRKLLEVNSGGGAAFTPDGRRVVFSQAEVVDQFYVYDDLYSLDLTTGRVERLTEGMRARSPDVSPDGRRVVFVRNRLGRTQLALLDLSDGSTRQLVPFDERRQVYTPRFSPDGRRVVFSASRTDGGRDIQLLELADERLRALTESRTMDLDPAFDAGGGQVIFSSDRTGIFNLYAVCLETGRLRRLTNVATGAFSPDPSPDGRGIAFTVYGPRGYDIAWLDLPTDDYPIVQDRAERPDPPYRDNPAVYPVQPYRPWSTLLPRSWVPTWGQDPWGTTLGLLVGGRDALGKLSYLANVAWGPANSQLYVDASLSARLFYPSLSMYVGRHVYRLSNQALVDDRPWPIDREEITLNLDVAFPFSSIRRYDAVFINYDIHLYDRWTAIGRDPQHSQPVLPNDSPLAWIGVGWYGAETRRFLDSISTEEGLAASVSLRLSHPVIGSGSHLAEARAWLRGYIPVVKRHHHVLALGLQAGLAVGDERRRSLFSVGGLPIRDPVRDAYYGYRYSGLYLRGYEQWAFVGSAYLLGSLEYRLPIVDIERGLLTLPFYLQKLHAGVFVDFGGASRDPSLDRFAKDLLKVGIGAELRLDMLLAYYLPFSIRLGYGRGLMAGGINNWYLTLGSGF